MTSSNKNLLLVDDEKNVLYSLQQLLRDEGYQIFTASSGPEGLKIIQQQPIQVVLSDLMMPEMDGVKFLEKAAEVNPEAVQILLTGHASLETAVDAINRLGLFGFIVKPWKNEVLKSDVRSAFEKHHLVSENNRLYRLTLEQNNQLAQWNETLEDRVKNRTHLLEEAIEETILLLARIAETRDGQLEGHIYRVADLTFDLCRALDLPPEESARISQFSMVHDIGKVCVNETILNKQAPLTENEQAELQSHTILGETLLGVKPFYQTARQIVRSHHEHWDGSGYPDGLGGQEIPLPARIVAVADMFDHLRHQPKGKKRISLVEALKTIRSCAGIQLDPQVTEAMIRKKKKKIIDKKKNTSRPARAVNF